MLHVLLSRGLSLNLSLSSGSLSLKLKLCSGQQKLLLEERARVHKALLLLLLPLLNLHLYALLKLKLLNFKRQGTLIERVLQVVAWARIYRRMERGRKENLRVTLCKHPVRVLQTLSDFGFFGRGNATSCRRGASAKDEVKEDNPLQPSARGKWV